MVALDQISGTPNGQSLGEGLKRLVDDLRGLISSDAPDPAVLLSEVERLTSELEAHLDYEEEQLIPILDAFTRESRAR